MGFVKLNYENNFTAIVTLAYYKGVFKIGFHLWLKPLELHCWTWASLNDSTWSRPYGLAVGQDGSQKEEEDTFFTTTMTQCV